MKHEWKKHEKELYTNIKKPTLITIPKQNFITISGTGNPNNEDFAERVGVLMSLAYPIKMSHKEFCKNNPEDTLQFAYDDYSVFPLEGVWTSEGNPLNKDNLSYTIMVRQPDFITKDMFKDTFAIVEKKKPHNFLQDVKFESIEDGLSVQMLHIGAFDDEPASFAQMKVFMKENGFERVGTSHREIYLNDPRKTKPEKYRTILRYCVQRGENMNDL